MLLLLLVAVFGVRRAPTASTRVVLAAGLLILAPLPAVWLQGPEERLVSGSEGVLEAVTEGLLLALLWHGVRNRQPWIACGAAVLFLEEIDYGQLWLGFATPEWWDALSDRSSQTNLHNIDGLDWLWRPFPMLAVLVLSRRPLRWSRLESLMTRLRLPVLDRTLGWGLFAAVAGVWPVLMIAGDRRMNESLELALVALVFLTVRPQTDLNPA